MFIIFAFFFFFFQAEDGIRDHCVTGVQTCALPIFPVATVPELDAQPVLPVRLLGEDLALYRTEQGKLGLVSERCAHRGASLAYGIPEADGLRCPYHGWKYDATGQCVDQPAEPPDSTFKQRICIPGYPVQALG